jgi:hypothetical protein
MSLPKGKHGTCGFAIQNAQRSSLPNKPSGDEALGNVILHQLAHWSTLGLGLRIGIVTFRVQCGHFLRWLVINRLTRNTSTSGWRISMSGALRANNAKCKSYLSRISLAITIISGQVARNTDDLLVCCR